MTYGYYRSPNDDRDQLYDRLGNAFSFLRAAGFVAKNRFSCCRGCAGAEIAEQVGKSPRSKTCAGAVFTTRQDWDSPTTSIHLSYGPVVHYGNDERRTTYGYPTEVVGRAVKEACELAGLVVLWDGDPSKCLEVCLPSRADKLREQQRRRDLEREEYRIAAGLLARTVDETPALPVWE